DAKPRPQQIGQSLMGFSIGTCEEFAKKAKASLGGDFHVRGGVEASPESAARSLLAVAEKRPAHVRLVVLRQRQGERQEQHETLVVQTRRVSGQLARPVGIIT